VVTALARRALMVAMVLPEAWRSRDHLVRHMGNELALADACRQIREQEEVIRLLDGDRQRWMNRVLAATPQTLARDAARRAY
jgi:hypothetical protein